MNKFSKNPYTMENIIIPSKLDDKEGIDKFIGSNVGRKIIVVQGLGFVGAVMSIVCANSEKEKYAVIGIDLPNENNYWKIDSINRGVFPVVSSDPKVEEFFEKSKNKNNFYATYDEYAYSLADYIIVDINLDVKKETDFIGNVLSYDVNLNPFKRAIESIGNNCKEEVLILVETTVPPGTCEKVVKPLIKTCLKKRDLRDDLFSLGHSYERVMPGPNYIDSIQNYFRVFSGINKKSEIEVENFLKTIISTNKYPLTKLNNTNATEIAKVLENSYRAMNIAFITEWSRFAEEANVNLYDIVNAIRMRPTHSNMMFPGIGVGGYCLTKDPLLASWSRKNLFSSKELLQSENGVKVNGLMPLFAFNFLKDSIYNKKLKGLNILLCGVSYRSEVADTRFSPVENFYKFCNKEKANILLHDPYVKYWEELNLQVNDNLDELLEININIIVISTSHEFYKSERFIKKILNKNKMIILDMVGVFDKNQILELSNFHAIRVLGRGDI